MDKFLLLISTANGIEGEFQRIAGGYHYLGCKIYNNMRVGIIFIPNIGDKALVRLSGLKDLCHDDNLLIVLSPAFLMDDIALKDALSHKKIIHLSLAESLNYRTFKLSLMKSVSRILEAEEGRKSIVTEMSDKQNEDYQKYKYLCYDKLNITGMTTPEGKNLITVNADKITIEEANFLLLLRLVVELKKNQGGWMQKNLPYEKGDTVEPLKSQIYSRLRKEMTSSLQEKDGLKFIENNKRGHYRISAHPDFVRCDKATLLKNASNRAKSIVEKLPNDQ